MENSLVNDKTSITPQLKYNFGKGREIFPFRKMTKKKKLVNVLFVDEKTGENNKLVLKFEIRRMSQKSLEIIIYSPFLILNETEFTLFYRSGKNISKMNEDILMMDYDWAKKIESLNNE